MKIPQKCDAYKNSPHHCNDINRSKSFCLDSKCYYYYGEIDECMYGEPDIPTDEVKKCEREDSV